MGVRVGYVNVQGLSAQNWESIRALLNTSFDLLFLAETWYIDHRLRQHDRQFVAATPQPSRTAGFEYRPGRPKGGLYLCATTTTQGRIVNTIRVRDYSITVRIDGWTITGVYFPPSMTIETLDRELREGCGRSSVILGDVNTRFPDPVYQSGAPGPPERLRLL